MTDNEIKIVLDNKEAKNSKSKAKRLQKIYKNHINEEWKNLCMCTQDQRDIFIDMFYNEWNIYYDTIKTK